MIRNSFALKLNPGARLSFGKILSENWDELKEHLAADGISNFSIWNAEDLLFGYFESESEMMQLSDNKKDYYKELNHKFQECYTWISTPFVPMRLMYQDFGIVRENKELIRHRVFITKLVPGSEEEYKRRHDELVVARGDKITTGPDSNFSIWNAGGYIFGYNEIDTTMERERTDADKEADIAWETKMFEIMSWITDDVDWISGEHHEHIKRICWFN